MSTNSQRYDDLITNRIHVSELATRWIPVSERLPEAETVVLAYFPQDYESGVLFHIKVAYRNSKGWWVWAGNADMSGTQASHWCPLPGRPEGMLQ